MNSEGIEGVHATHVQPGAKPPDGTGEEEGVRNVGGGAGPDVEFISILVQAAGGGAGIPALRSEKDLVFLRERLRNLQRRMLWRVHLVVWVGKQKMHPEACHVAWCCLPDLLLCVAVRCGAFQCVTVCSVWRSVM